MLTTVQPSATKKKKKKSLCSKTELYNAELGLPPLSAACWGNWPRFNI